MKTDVTPRSASGVIVMDAKFYKAPIGRNEYGDLKHHAANLYQLYAYLRHAQDRDPRLPIEGALVYTSTGQSFDMRYRLREHQVRIVTLDLDQAWPDIHRQLLELIQVSVQAAAA